jgi:hypothetical protein
LRAFPEGPRERVLRFGIRADFVDTSDIRNVEKAVQGRQDAGLNAR